MNNDINILTGLLDDTTINIKEPVYTYNKIPVPRVTEIISKMISEEYLMYWANGLGFKGKGYKKTLTEASDIGSKNHDAISEYILNGSIPINKMIPFNAFLKWFDNIKKSCSYKVIGSEVSITCPYFGGTYDLLIDINGLIYLVDFKTSNNVSYKYFLQLSAYRYILLTEYGININGFIILQLDKNKEDYEEYILHMDNSDHSCFMENCISTFLSLVYGYYNIQSIETNYKEIFKRR